MINWRQDDNEEELEETRELLCVSLGKVFLGMELPSISEIIREWSATPLPLVPDYCEGVFSWKGLILLLVSLQKLAGTGQAEAFRGENLHEAAVILKAGEMECAFAVPDEPRLLTVRESERLQGSIPAFFGELIAIRDVYVSEKQVIYVMDAEATLNNLVIYV